MAKGYDPEASEVYGVIKEAKQAPVGDIKVKARGGGAATRGLDATWIGGVEPITDYVNLKK